MGAGLLVLGCLLRMPSSFDFPLLMSCVIFGVFTSTLYSRPVGVGTLLIWYQPRNQPTTTKEIKAAAANARRFFIILSSEIEFLGRTLPGPGRGFSMTGQPGPEQLLKNKLSIGTVEGGLGRQKPQRTAKPG